MACTGMAELSQIAMFWHVFCGGIMSFAIIEDLLHQLAAGRCQEAILFFLSKGGMGG
jgi:hypothetical protein